MEGDELLVQRREAVVHGVDGFRVLTDWIGAKALCWGVVTLTKHNTKGSSPDGQASTLKAVDQLAGWTRSGVGAMPIGSTVHLIEGDNLEGAYVVESVHPTAR